MREENKFYVKNEKELGRNIVVPLLKSMGFSNVRYVCGSDEYGRDIIFSDTDKFRGIRWLAAQVKNV
ncbi:MAG: hypothetical protein AABX05_02725, partial [Nanoarchaeota archaeon]